jgi:salicylate hydroxylase
MLSYLAQGAAQYTEDAGTLRTALKTSNTLLEALARYEHQRIPRAAAITQNTRVHQEAMHVYDGPDQALRDLVMGRDIPENPIWWAYSKRRDWLFGHDAEILNDEAVPWDPSLTWRNFEKGVDGQSYARYRTQNILGNLK